MPIEQAREATRAAELRTFISQAYIQRLWNEIHEAAAAQGTEPFAVSTAMTLFSLGNIGSLGRGSLSTVTATGTLLDRHVIEHYVAGLNNVREKGIYAALAEAGEPYIDAVWMNFSTEKTTITEELFSGRLTGKGWNAVRRWLGGANREQE